MRGSAHTRVAAPETEVTSWFSAQGCRFCRAKSEALCKQRGSCCSGCPRLFGKGSDWRCSINRLACWRSASRSSAVCRLLERPERRQRLKARTSRRRSWLLGSGKGKGTLSTSRRECPLRPPPAPHSKPSAGAGARRSLSELSPFRHGRREKIALSSHPIARPRFLPRVPFPAPVPPLCATVLEPRLDLAVGHLERFGQGSSLCGR